MALGKNIRIEKLLPFLEAWAGEWKNSKRYFQAKALC